MQYQRRSLFAALPLLWACSNASTEPCGPGEEGQAQCLGQTQQQIRSFQGRSFQGRSFQGRSFQGTGTAVTMVQQFTKGGIAVDGIQLTGTTLSGSLAGQPISGTGFIGSTVTQVDPDGTVFDATITNVQLDPQDSRGEVLLYTMTAYDATTGTVRNICEPDPWGGQWATPVYGSWDNTGAHIPSTTQLMFGCTSGVVAKCIRWGYRPWKTVNGRSLADYHQTCTRMARADYCGDGVSHTEENTLIDLYDDLGIQVQSPFNLFSPMIFDGAWTTRGAYCMTKDRWLNLSQLVSVTLECKTKFLSLFPLLETSPVAPLDLCAIKRPDISRSDVHIDNKSSLNIQLN